MALTYTQRIVLFIVAASILGVTAANNGWQYGWGYNQGPNKTPNCTNSPRKIVVGGSDQWKFGVNYTDWSINNAPFYFNDTLVFKYDPPSDSNTHPHSVYLLPHIWSFWNCDFTRARMIANVSDGAGEGFEFTLKRWWKPYFFACGASNGFHCNNGMKFMVFPLLHPWHF